MQTGPAGFMPMPEPKPVRAFVSHSGKDKKFVRKLLNDLKQRDLNVWFDERELGVGDSIVEGISGGLQDTDYLIVVLSEASVQSRWVGAELNAAMMQELSGKGTVVLPALIEDCDIPVLLRDRVYADFRKSYKVGLSAIFRVLNLEFTSALDLSLELAQGDRGPAQGDRDPCSAVLSKLTLADLRRRMTTRLGRSEVATIWFDTLETKMEDDMASWSSGECIIELLDRVRKRNLLSSLIGNICRERSDLMHA